MAKRRILETGSDGCQENGDPKRVVLYFLPLEMLKRQKRQTQIKDNMLFSNESCNLHGASNQKRGSG
jgi:hypothetical protein